MIPPAPNLPKHFLEELLQPGVHSTYGHCDLCEGVVTAWLERQEAL